MEKETLASTEDIEKLVSECKNISTKISRKMG